MHRPGQVVGLKNSKKFKRLDLLLYSRQSRFRRMYTTETALMKLVDELLFSLDNNHVHAAWSWLIIVRLLLRKLELYGMVNRELAGCHSYWLGRKQVVRVNGSESSNV